MANNAIPDSKTFEIDGPRFTVVNLFHKRGNIHPTIYRQPQ